MGQLHMGREQQKGLLTCLLSTIEHEGNPTLPPPCQDLSRGAKQRWTHVVQEHANSVTGARPLHQTLPTHTPTPQAASQQLLSCWSPPQGVPLGE